MRFGKDDVWARVMGDGEDVAQVRNHERVARRGRKLLHHAGDVERGDPQLPRPAIKDT